MRGGMSPRSLWLGAVLALAGRATSSKVLRSGESRLMVTELWAHNAGQVPVQTDFPTRSDETFVFTTGESGDIFAIPSQVEIAAMPAAAVASIRASVYNVGSLGLTSVKADPEFEDHPYVYALYTVQPNDFDKNVCDASGKGTKWLDGSKPFESTVWCRSMARLSRFRVTKTDFGFKQSEEVVLMQDWCSSAQEHQTGDILFLASGEMLVSAGDCSHSDCPDAGVGDAAALDDCVALDNVASVDGLGKLGGVWRAQRDDSLCGKVIRISQDQYRMGGRALSSSTSTTAKGGLLGASDVTIVAKGLRFPARMAQHSSGDVYLSDQGLKSQEINVIPAPAETEEVVNFGWPCWEDEGAAPTWPGMLASLSTVDTGVSTTFCSGLESAVTAPAYAYTTALDKEGKCKSGQGLVSGLDFYYGEDLPNQYQGALFVADANKDCLVYFPENSKGQPTLSTPGLVFYESDKDVKPAMSDVRYANGNLYVASPGYTTITKLSRGSSVPPKAAITLTDFTHHAGESITFDASASKNSDPNSKFVSWTFDFGDNSTKTVSGSSPPKLSHAYDESGIYKFSLTATNSLGFTDTYTAGLLIDVNFVFETTPESGAWSVDQPLSYAMTASGAALPSDSVSWKIYAYQCFMNDCKDANDCYEIELDQALYSQSGATGSVDVPQDFDYPWSLVFYATIAGDSVGGLTVGPMRYAVNPLTYKITIGRTNNFILDSVVSAYSTRNNQQCIYNEEECQLSVTAGGKLSIRAPLAQATAGDVYKFDQWLVNGAAAQVTTTDGLYATFAINAPAEKPDNYILNATYTAVGTVETKSMLVSPTMPKVNLAVTQVQAGYGNLYVAFQTTNRQTGKVDEWPADFIFVYLTTDAKDMEYPEAIPVPQHWAWPDPEHQQDVTIQVPTGRHQWSVSIKAYNLDSSQISPAVKATASIYSPSSGNKNSPCVNQAVCSATDGDIMCADYGVLDAGDVVNGYGLFYDANCVGDARGFIAGCGVTSGNCRLCLLNRCLYQQLHSEEVLSQSIGDLPDCPTCVASLYSGQNVENPLTGKAREFTNEINSAEDPACDCVGDSCYATLAPTPSPTTPAATGSDFCDLPADDIKCQFLASPGDIEDGITLVYDPRCLAGQGLLGCTYSNGEGTRPECRYCIYDKCKYSANRGLAAGAANEFEFCGGTSGLGADCVFDMGGLPYVNKKQDYACSSPAPSPSEEGGTPAPTTTYTCSGGYLDDICDEGSATLVTVTVTSDAQWYLNGVEQSAATDLPNAVVVCPGAYSMRFGMPNITTQGMSPDTFNWTVTMEGYSTTGITGHSIDSTSLYVGGYSAELDDVECWTDCRKSNLFCDACTSFAAMFDAPAAPLGAAPCDCPPTSAEAAITKSACLDAGCDADTQCGGVSDSDFTIDQGTKVVYRMLIGSIDTNAVSMYSAADLTNAVTSAAATWLGVSTDELTLLAINGLNTTEFAALDMSTLNSEETKGYLRIAVETGSSDAVNGAATTATLASSLAPNPGFANCAVVGSSVYSANTYYVDSISDPRDQGKQKKKIGGLTVGAVVGIAIAGLVAAAVVAGFINRAHKNHKAKKAAAAAAGVKGAAVAAAPPAAKS